MISTVMLFIRWLFKKGGKPTATTFASNPLLSTILISWPGTPLDQNGLFMNYEFPTLISLRAVLRFMFQRNPQRKFKKHDTCCIGVIKNDDWLSDPSDKIVWLGHASFFIQLSGKRILIDPIFGKLPIGKRYSEMPVNPRNLTDIDYFLISHAHYDHCDNAV